MIPVLTISQMREVDKRSINGEDTVGFAYMQRAGEALFDTVCKLAPDPEAGEITIFCGKGNNGGDGFCVGSLLLAAGYKVMVYVLCEPYELKGEARIAFDKYDLAEGNFLVLDDIADVNNLPKSILVIDALLGTGMRGAVHGIYADAMKAMNAVTVPVLSVDTPSGLNNDTGDVGILCVKATTTVAMGFPKLGSYYYPGKSYVGTLEIADLGYPVDIVDNCSSGVFLPSHAELKQLLPSRKPAGSKFDHGVALMVCGSQGMAGAATLASVSALKTGCGMVHLASPKSMLPVLAGKLTEVVLHGIDETDAGSAAMSAQAFIESKMALVQVLCIGPGLSHHDETSRLVRAVVALSEKPIVLDADGINAFVGKHEDLKQHKANILITPHRGEWERLFGQLPTVPSDIVLALRAKAKEYNLTILYKGNPTLVADPQGNVVISPYGNSGMATAGSGDVLSGIITSLIAQGATVTNAAILGAYIHGTAGNEAAEKLTEYSVTASDIMDAIHCSIVKLI